MYRIYTSTSTMVLHTHLDFLFLAYSQANPQAAKQQNSKLLFAILFTPLELQCNSLIYHRWNDTKDSHTIKIGIGKKKNARWVVSVRPLAKIQFLLVSKVRPVHYYHKQESNRIYKSLFRMADWIELTTRWWWQQQMNQRRKCTDGKVQCTTRHERKKHSTFINIYFDLCDYVISVVLSFWFAGIWYLIL